MKLVNRVNQMFKEYLSWIVLLTAVASLVFPSGFAWLAVWITLMLQFIMFTMGATMKTSDFSEVFKQPVRVLVVVATQYLFMPLSAYVLAKLFQLPAEIALGLILVGAVPGGTSSNVITYLAKGDVPLSITATSISTLLSPLFTPLALSFYGGAFIEIAFWPMSLSIVQVVLVPIFFGLLVNRLFGTHTEKVESFLPTLSSIAVLIVLAGTVAVNRDNLVSTGWVIFLVVFLHNLSGYGSGYLVSRLLGYSKESTRAIAIEVSIQNTGLAASLGLAHFTPMAALAGATGAMVHTLLGSIYANLCVKYDERQAQTTAKTAKAKEASTETASVQPVNY